MEPHHTLDPMLPGEQEVELSAFVWKLSNETQSSGSPNSSPCSRAEAWAESERTKINTALEHLVGVRSSNSWDSLGTKTSGKMIKSFKQTFLSLDLQSPRWSSIETMAKDSELRQYETAKWVSTVIKGETQKEAMRQGFWKLFHYIQGKNEKEIKIDMTVPVTCLVKSGCADFKISFFVPFEHQDSPPQPTDSDVFVEERKAAAIFVRSFSGFASPDKYAEEAEALAKLLRNRGQPFHEDFFYTAGYDSPFKLFNRHNEVWYFRK